jgi:large subunit ribosomal protein L24
MAANNKKATVNYAKAAISKKIKMGARTVVSEALVKKGVTNLVPKMHVKRGDLVIVTSGSKELGRGKTGKILKVLPTQGKVIVEGINMLTRAVKPKTALGKSGLVKEEGPIFASKVMLYSPKAKKGVRAEFRNKENLG